MHEGMSSDVLNGMGLLVIIADRSVQAFCLVIIRLGLSFAETWSSADAPYESKLYSD